MASCHDECMGDDWREKYRRSRCRGRKLGGAAVYLRAFAVGISRWVGHFECPLYYIGPGGCVRYWVDVVVESSWMEMDGWVGSCAGCGAVWALVVLARNAEVARKKWEFPACAKDFE